MFHTERIVWLDRARGISIILVVLGHFIQNNEIPSIRFYQNIIYSFHMGCFFIISGWLASPPKKGDSFLYFVKRRFLTLVIPYIFFCMLILLKNLIENFFFFDMQNITLFQRTTLIDSILMVRVSSYFSGLWFLPALFCAELIFWFVLHTFRHTAVQGLLCLIISFYGYRYSMRFPVKLPMNLEIGAIAVVFLWIGFIAHALPSDFWVRPIYCIVSLFVLLSANVYSYFVAQNGIDSFYYPYFPNPLLSAITILTGTYLVFAVGHLSIPFLGLIGRNSLYIYGLHYLFLSPLIHCARLLNVAESNTLCWAILSALQTVIVVFFCVCIAQFYRKICAHNPKTIVVHG